MVTYSGEPDFSNITIWIAKLSTISTYFESQHNAYVSKLNYLYWLQLSSGCKQNNNFVHKKQLHTFQFAGSIFYSQQKMLRVGIAPSHLCHVYAVGHSFCKKVLLYLQNIICVYTYIFLMRNFLHMLKPRWCVFVVFLTHFLFLISISLYSTASNVIHLLSTVDILIVNFQNLGLHKIWW